MKVKYQKFLTKPIVIFVKLRICLLRLLSVLPSSSLFLPFVENKTKILRRSCVCPTIPDRFEANRIEVPFSFTSSKGAINEMMRSTVRFFSALSLSLSVSTDCRHYAVKSHLWLCWTLFFRNQRNWKQKKISWFSSLAIIDFIKNRFNNILRTFSVHSEFIVIDSTTDLALPFVFNTFSYTWNIYKLIASNEKWSARGKTTERITIIDHNRVNKPKGFVLFSSRLTRSQRKIGFSFRDPSASLAHNYYVFNALQDDERRRLCDGVTVNVNGVAGKWTPFVAAVPQRASKQASKQARAGVRIVKLNWIYIIILPEYMGRRNFLIIVFRVSDVSTKVYVRRSLRGA